MDFRKFIILVVGISLVLLIGCFAMKRVKFNPKFQSQVDRWKAE